MQHALVDSKGNILVSHAADEFVEAVIAKLTPAIAGLLDGQVAPLVAVESDAFREAVIKKLSDPIIGWRAGSRRAELESKIRQAFVDVEIDFRQRSLNVP